MHALLYFWILFHTEGNMKNFREKNSTPKKPIAFHEGQKVALLISARTEMGHSAVINGTHKGILYKNEVFQPLKIGQEIEGFIKKIRPDGKIDLCLQKPGYRAADALSRKIIDRLQRQAGFLPITDKSPPKTIADLFGVSKKTFKKTIGNLYKKRLISLEKDGIRLRDIKPNRGTLSDAADSLKK
jgi:predicted RNA-binding protein (virulence factor B family)